MKNSRLTLPESRDNFDTFFVVFMIFNTVLALAVLGGLSWAVFELVTWVTSK